MLPAILRCFSFFKPRPNPSFFPGLVNANKTKLMQIYEHPFNVQLFNGALPPITFGRYLRDDYFYLHHFSSALHVLSEQTINVNLDLTEQLNSLANDIINSELNMQLQYKVHLHNIRAHTAGDSITAYTDFLSKTVVHSELAVGLSAVLPCFWSYYQLGIIHRYSQDPDSNPYKEWIETYSSKEFIAATRNLANTVSLLGEQATPEIQEKMKEAFKIGVQFELDFIDEIYTYENNMRLRA